MKILIVLCGIVFVASSAMGAIKTQVVEYKQGDTTLEGYLVYDDSTSDRRPGVMVVHEWWGNNQYPRKRAEELAQLGYVAFAADMFGKGKVTDDPKQAGQWAGQFKADPELAKARAMAGLEQLKAQPMVDPDRLAAIGYCFGGTMVLQMARANMPVRGVVSFHGSLGGGIPVQGQIGPRILVCSGAEDQFVPQQEIDGFKEEMKKAGADYVLIQYAGAHHSFTNPDADRHHMPNIAYNAEADRRSWQHMKDFFAEVLGR